MLLHDTFERLPNVKVMLLEPFALKASATAEIWDTFESEVLLRAEAVWFQHDLVFHMAAAGAAPLALKRDFLIPGNRDDLFVHKTSYGKTAATKTVAAVGGSGGNQTGNCRRGFIHAATAIRIDAATAA